MTLSQMPPKRLPLQRVLGVWTGAAVGIGVAIGAGIFRTPGYVAGFLPDPWQILAVWLFGGLLVLGDCLILAELASRYPRAGGWYVYIEQGWGSFPAFVYGWVFMLIVNPASSAALVVIFGEYLASLFGLAPAVARLLAIGLTLGLFGLSLAGIRVGARTQLILTYTKLGALLAVGVAAFLLPHAGAAGPAVGQSPGSGVGIWAGVLAVGAALQGVLWTFEGYANTTTMTGESRDPRRTIPLALIGGTLALTVAYFVVNAAYLHILGRDALAASQLPGADIAGRLFGDAGHALFLIVAILAAVGSLNGGVLSAPRVAYALGRSGLAPEPLTRVTKVGTPDVATLWFALAWTVYASFGTFEELIAISIFIGALANVAVTAALFRIRRRDGLDAEAAPGRPWLSPAYPGLPIAMLLLWGTFAGVVLAQQGPRMLYGLGITLLAWPAHYFWRRRRGA